MGMDIGHSICIGTDFPGTPRPGNQALHKLLNAQDGEGSLSWHYIRASGLVPKGLT